jgi:hypothetical protein
MIGMLAPLLAGAIDEGGGGMLGNILSNFNPLERLQQITIPHEMNPDSSAILHAAYEPITKDIGNMDITFTSGRTYSYPVTSLDTWKGFVEAMSKGGYYNAYIKGRRGDATEYLIKKGIKTLGGLALKALL